MKRRLVSPEMVAAAVSSIALHTVWLAREAKASFGSETRPTEMLLEADLSPKPAEPKEEPQTAPPEHEDPAPPVRAAAPRPLGASKPAAPAAQAGRTLTAPETNDAKSDVADFTMIQGSGTTYAGGTTTATGTSTTAVRGPVTDGPAIAAGRPAPAPATLGPDRSRRATPAVGDWNCSQLFPTDSGAADSAAVLIAVTVLPSGKPRSVSVLRDPGHGFGPAAKACAMAQTYTPALDRDGSPIVATTPPITVRFIR